MISVNNLRKSFGDFVAVDNLSFTVEPGDVVGFLGPNGAGKSTTMKMLTGFLAADAGSISISNMDINTDAKAIQTRLGYLPEGAPAYGDMTPLQFLHFIADIRGLKGQDKSQRIAQVVQQVELEPVLDRAIDNLSKGFKRRVGLAQAIIHDPEILILDEPTDGLDPNQKHQVRKLIQNLAKDKIVIVSTHILEEVTAVCNRVMIIAGGKMLFDSTPEALQQRSRFHNAIRVQFSELPNTEAFAALPQVRDMQVNNSDNSLLLFPDSEQPLLPAVNRLMQEQGLVPNAVFVEQGRLDDVFRELTTEGGQ